MGNLWAMKAILRCFELVSGLRINFHKSRILGVNVDQNFQQDAAMFLNCKCGGIPFQFLGIPIGAKRQRESTRQPVIDKMKKRLSSWQRRHISMGGRVTLINSVLNNLPIYFFVFI